MKKNIKFFVAAIAVILTTLTSCQKAQPEKLLEYAQGYWYMYEITDSSEPDVREAFNFDGEKIYSGLCNLKEGTFYNASELTFKYNDGTVITAVERDPSYETIYDFSKKPHGEMDVYMHNGVNLNSSFKMKRVALVNKE